MGAPRLEPKAASVTAMIGRDVFLSLPCCSHWPHPGVLHPERHRHQHGVHRGHGASGFLEVHLHREAPAAPGESPAVASCPTSPPRSPPPFTHLLAFPTSSGSCSTRPAPAPSVLTAGWPRSGETPRWADPSGQVGPHAAASVAQVPTGPQHCGLGAHQNLRACFMPRCWECLKLRRNGASC